MKGLILAAGLGTRLRPLTNSRPKPIIAVANKPLILHAIENLVEADVTNIGIVVSGATVNDIKETLKDYKGASLHYIMQASPEGLAHAVKVSRDFLKDEPFVMYLSDNLFERGIKTFVDAFRQAKGDYNAVLALIRVEDPRQFGVVVVEDGRITKLIEKPKDPPSNLAVAGVYVFDVCIHDTIEGLKPSARGEYEITDAIHRLIERGKKVAPVEVSGWWKDTGNPEDILDANRLVLSRLEPRQLGTVENSRIVGQVVVEEGAVIKNSTVIGPAIIGSGAVLEDAYVGPFTSIGPGVKIKNAELEYAVVEQDTVIDSVAVRIQSSLIGASVEIRGRKERPSTHQLILGDRSKAQIQE
jgi:glucose-1-phosphate thymidylyltransferase